MDIDQQDEQMKSSSTHLAYTAGDLQQITESECGQL